jgi:hypothetical protein
VPGSGVGQLGKLLGHPRRCRTAVRRARGQRAAHGQHGPHVGSQALVHGGQLAVLDLPQLTVVLVAPADQPPADLVRLPERDA